MLEVGWWGSLRDLSKNILKQGVGKGEGCSQLEGVLKVLPPLPPPENFNYAPCSYSATASGIISGYYNSPNLSSEPT